MAKRRTPFRPSHFSRPITSPYPHRLAGLNSPSTPSYTPLPYLFTPLYADCADCDGLTKDDEQGF